MGEGGVIALTLTQSVVIFARGDRLAVRLYDTPAEARAAAERAMRDGTADSVGQGRFYQISLGKERAE